MACNRVRQALGLSSPACLNALHSQTLTDMTPAAVQLLCGSCACELVLRPTSGHGCLLLTAPAQPCCSEVQKCF